MRQASEDLPAVVFLDIGMPTMDGIEVARRMRLSHSNNVKIVACTGYVERSISAQIGAAEFDAVLLKPMPVGAIVETIGRLTQG